MVRNSPRLNKAGNARRLVHVLDYFDKNRRSATVTELVKHYGWPQSSTSELLYSLVEVGVLSLDRSHRHFSPTVRAAFLGMDAQQGIVRDGRLNCLLDRLEQQTGLGVGAFHLVGASAEIIAWRSGTEIAPEDIAQIGPGMRCPAHRSAAGLLLLSTLECSHRTGLLRRLNSEACADDKFNPFNISSQARELKPSGTMCGAFGFDASCCFVGMLVPSELGTWPLVIGFAHMHGISSRDAELLALLKDGMSEMIRSRQEDDNLDEHTSAA